MSILRALILCEASAFSFLCGYVDEGDIFAEADVENVVSYVMKGSKRIEREVYEQYVIDKIGIKKLININNPMAGRCELYNSMIDHVNHKFNLPRL